MRLAVFEANGPKVGLLKGRDHVIDVARADVDLRGDLFAIAGDEALSRKLDKMSRGVPPDGTLRRVEKMTFLSPVAPERVWLAGGAEADVQPKTVVAPGGGLPAGEWTTGVAAVIRHRTTSFDPEKWQQHVLGFAPFFLSGDQVMVGPCIATWEEVKEPTRLTFAAFVDDLSRIRPVKALLDWGATMAAANDARTLRAGDLVGLAAPPTQVLAGEPARAALSVEGMVLARLEAMGA